MPFGGLSPKLCATLILFWSVAGSASACFAQKDALSASINQRDEAAWQAALQIWQWAEPGYQEQNSSALLAKMLEDAGFAVQRGVAGMPTAFTATAGAGRPVIGILGEFDALPGLSQEALPYRQPREENAWGHGCGHHLFGVASASAAIAVAEQIAAGNLQGTVRYYGCPAEEGGGAKVFMVRGGLFDDCDAVLHWHPSAENSAGDRSTMARISAKFRFKGKPAHAAGAPDQGRSALDAVELTNHAAQLLREHTPDFTRIHHVITAGGDAPNVVPEFTEVYYYVRHPKADVVRPLYKRLLLCAEAGALATETQLEVRFEGGIMETLPNNTLGQVALANLTALNNLEYTADELAFATRIQESLESPKPMDSVKQVSDRTGNVGKGSTDVGDISWVVPTTGFTTACWAPGTPGHSWQATAAGGTSIGRKGMNLAARVLAATAWDLLSNPQTLQAAKDEHQRLLGEKKYDPLMPADQPPPLDYRKPPRNE
jgi:aminobenzoyl-glutamate utilization protein B